MSKRISPPFEMVNPISGEKPVIFTAENINFMTQNHILWVIINESILLLQTGQIFKNCNIFKTKILKKS